MHIKIWNHVSNFPSKAIFAKIPSIVAKIFHSFRLFAMVESAPIRGLWCASLTPLGADGSVDCASLVAHVHRLTAKGLDGIVLFGTTGEGASFSMAEGTGGWVPCWIPTSRRIAWLPQPVAPRWLTRWH